MPSAESRSVAPWSRGRPALSRPTLPLRRARTALRAAAVAVPLCVALASSFPAAESRAQGPASPADSWLNARAYPDLQAAVNACGTGHTLFIPAGDYHVPSGGLVLTKPIAIRGEPGTRLLAHAAAPNEPVIRIDPGSTLIMNIQLHDLKLMNASRPDRPIPGNYGLVCEVVGTGAKVGDLLLDRVLVGYMGDDGIHLVGAGTGDRCFVYVTLRNVKSFQSRKDGLVLDAANLVSIYDSNFSDNDGCGIRAHGSSLQLLGCSFQNNCRSAALDERWAGQAYLKSCLFNRFDACVWEQFATPGQPSNKRALTIENSVGCTVGNCWFLNPVEDPDPRQRAIYVTYGDQPGVMACTLLPNRFDNVRTAIEVDATPGHPAQDCVVFPQMVAKGTGAMILPDGEANSGLVRLGGRTRDAAGEPVTRGVSVPALPSASLPTLGSSGAGTVVFDLTRQKLLVWDGSAWQVVQSE